MSIIADILTIILVLISVFLILVVLMQKGSANGGMGAAMGGGMAEAALGAETTTVLTKVTRNTAIVFFVMVFGLGLAYIYINSAAQEAEDNALPEFAASEEAGPGLLETISGAETTAEEAAETLVEQVEAVSQEAENATSAATEQPEN
ncbi:MAG: preprotein translocase subunit SecG [Verrucomicrobiota bacterium]|nr:preprotein translocase subunit SecG [Verrucomicrobiota bacterium]